MKTLHRLNRYLLIVTVLVFTSYASCKKSADRNLTVVFYNVENLFDLSDDPAINDEEFTPGSDKKWDQKKYSKKLEDISRVISEINEDDLPEIVGLCEVENEQVLRDLVDTGLLSKGKYSFVHHDSPDTRGIDCALIYRRAEFRVIGSRAIPVRLENELSYTTRDILYVKGQTRNREEFHIFVNHWPSRSEGVAQSEWKRLETARILRKNIDLVLIENPDAHIMVMGDMNDDPDRKSLYEVLGAAPPSDKNARLVNLMFPDFNSGTGSYSYRGNWNMLDNLIVSSGLFDEEGFRCVEGKGHVFRERWMEYKNKDGIVSPNRTYGGPNYYGGVSDHFPVYFKLKR